jgi:hypothetical protein
MKYLLIFFAVAVFSACTESRSIPPDVYSPDKMERILWDMLLADRFAAVILVKDSAKIDVRQETFKVYEKVFSIHKTSQEEFARSFRYYLSRPDLTSVMFDSIYVRAGRGRIETYQRYR